MWRRRRLRSARVRWSLCAGCIVIEMKIPVVLRVVLRGGSGAVRKRVDTIAK